MKKIRPYAIAGIAVAFICVGFLFDPTLEIQLNLHSGELRKRRTIFGFQTSMTDPLPNRLSRTAERDGRGHDWLTVSTRSKSHQPCKEDWQTLLSCMALIIEMASGKEDAKDVARAVLDELNESRSLSGTTRHVVRVFKAIPKDGSQPNMLQLWQSSIQDPVFPDPESSSK